MNNKEYFEQRLRDAFSMEVEFLKVRIEDETDPSYFTKKLTDLTLFISVINSFSALLFSISSLIYPHRTKTFLISSFTIWGFYWHYIISNSHKMKNARELIKLALLASSIQLLFGSLSLYTCHTSYFKQSNLDFKLRVMVFIWTIPEYTSLALALFLLFLNFYYKDKEILQNRVKSQMNTAFVKVNKIHSHNLQHGVSYVQSFVEQLRFTMKFIQNTLRCVSILGELKIIDNRNNIHLLETKALVPLTQFYKICDRLNSLNYVNSGRIFGHTRSRSQVTNKFNFSDLIQSLGDSIGEYSNSEQVELIINDAELAFKEIKAFGSEIELAHILLKILLFACSSAVPLSNIELGIKLPTLSQAYEDPLHEDRKTLPFVFQITYSTTASADILEQTLANNELLLSMTQEMGAKISHFGESSKKTVYFDCALTVPNDSCAILGRRFLQNIANHEEYKLIMSHNLFLVSSSSSKFGTHLHSCLQLIGSNVRFITTEQSSITRFTKFLNDKQTLSKQTVIVINEDLPAFQLIVHDFLLRNTGEQGRRSAPNFLSIIFLLSQDSFQRSAQYLETTLAQCHSSYYPCVSLIIKPLGFRLFSSLLVSHINFSQNHAHNRFRRLTEPRLFSHNKSPSEHNQPRSPQSPRITHRHSNSNSAKSSPTVEKVVTPIEIERPLHKSPIPEIPTIKSPKNTKKEAPEKAEKATPIPLSKILPKSKLARSAAKLARSKLSPSIKKNNEGSNLSPNANQKRPGASDGSYFPQIRSLPINVLIVEDNPINQKILATFMKKRNIKYAVANDGQEAVDQWKKGGFHIVLMDIQLPVMDGIEATKEIRKIEKQRQIGFFSPSSSEPKDSGLIPTHSQLNTPSPRTPPTPIQSPVIIVALTASSLRTDRIEALAAGCNDFLTKPVSLVWLEKKIMEWGCMQALIDIEGWRRLKYKDSSPSTRTIGPATAPVMHSFPAAKLLDPTPNFNIRADAMLSKLKKAEEKKRSSSPSS